MTPRELQASRVTLESMRAWRRDLLAIQERFWHTVILERGGADHVIGPSGDEAQRAHIAGNLVLLDLMIAPLDKQIAAASTRGARLHAFFFESPWGMAIVLSLIFAALFLLLR